MKAHPLTPEESDWLAAYEAWAEMMFHEASERGYDHGAASTAADRYFAAKRAYEQDYGCDFAADPQRAGELYAKRRAA